jgi:glucokinase
MNKGVRHFLGIDIGGTKIALSVGSEDGRILASERLHGGTREEYRQLLPRMLERVNALIAEAGLERGDIVACGVSAPGPLDLRKGVIEKSPNMVWDAVPIQSDLEKELGLPVYLENDANAGALAEWFFGAARGTHDVVYLTMSTGIGGGIIAGNRLVRGVSGNAGELGHAILDVNGPVCGCGMRGCFEAFCSGRNVAERLRALVADQPRHPLLQMPEVDGNPNNLKYETLRLAVSRGIPSAQEFWNDICLRMAQGIGLYMMVFNPELIILGTIFYYSGDLLLEPVRTLLPRFVWPQILNDCRLELPALGGQLGELAGIAVGLYHLDHKNDD